jgi:biopolymer transport protein ExbB
MSNTQTNTKSGSNSMLPILVIIGALLVGFLFWKFICGASSNFQGGDNHNDPIPGNYLGMIYKGGFIVPILVAQLVIVLVFVIERFLSLNRATGSGSVDSFVKNIQYSVAKGDLNGAIAACDKQKGAVGNVVKTGVESFRNLLSDNSQSKDQKITTINKEIEEATSLELPMLEQNLPILATVASVATLFGLIGTVLGMIRSFAALANAGAPDSSALATGISEALINTALGISTSAIAIIAYNYFTSKIDGLTYKIDEAKFSLVQQFTAQQK